MGREAVPTSKTSLQASLITNETAPFAEKGFPLESEIADRLTAQGQEPGEIGYADGDRGRVHIRVKTDLLVVLQILVDYHPDILAAIVDQPKGGNGAGLQLQVLHQPLGGAETESVFA